MKRKLCAFLLIIALLFTFTVTPSVYAEANEEKTIITSLTTNYQENPMGIEQDNIRFGWKMESSILGQAQQYYQISLRKGAAEGEEVWNSGRVKSSQSSAIPYTGSELDAENRYFWTVNVTDIQGQEYSETAHFETGCDWSDASWITIQDYADGMDTLLFRTEQQLSNSNIASARLYITGLGSYEAYINGREVQGEKNSILAPGWSDYSSYIHYQTYDVKDYLDEDDSTVTLGAIVGTGWYGSSIVDASAVGYTAVIGDSSLLERCLYAKLVITYADNSSQVIVTDTDNWEVSDQTPYEGDGIYEGEVYNAAVALDLEGWNEKGFDVSGWTVPEELQYQGNVYASSEGIIYDYQELPMISAYSYDETEHIIAASDGSEHEQGEVDFTQAESYQAGDRIDLKAGDTLVADFGQNAAATVSFRISAPAGTTISMQPGESVSDGKDGIFTKGFLIPGACEGRGFTYIASGEAEEDYRAQLHFTGYQYMEIKADQDVTFYNLSSIAVSSIGEETGFAETSNDLLNQFISNSKWSQASNFISVPTDCPHREYYGWSGDAQLFAESGMYHFDSASFMSNYIDIMNDYQKTYGNYGSIMPMHTNSFFSKLIGAGWSDAGVIIPWVFYQQTGDLSIAEMYWDEMCSYTNKVYATGHLYSLGDWMGIGESSGTPFTAYAYNIHINQLMAQMAKGLGYTEDAEKYAQNAETKRRQAIDRYVTADGDVLSASADNSGSGFVDNAQTALAWCIKLKLYDTEEQRQTIAANLAASVRNENQSVSAIRNENTLSTGFLGVNVLLPALSESGNSNTAYALMTNTDLYTFLYSVASGSTSIWESWDIWTEDSGYEASDISLNHYSYGAASEWIYEYLLGIQKDEESPGFQHFILQPEADETLGYAKGSYNSYYGNIVSSWTVDGDKTTYSFEVPANTTATLYLEAEAGSSIGSISQGITSLGETMNNGNNVQAFQLESGGYEFTVENGTVTGKIADGYVLSSESQMRKLLGDTITDAQELMNTDEYENMLESLKAEFTAVLEDAITLYNNPNADDDALFDMFLELSNQINKLGFQKGDKAVLLRLIQACGLYDLDLYTPATVTILEEELIKANGVYLDGDAMQDEVERAVEALRQAMNGLRYRANKEVLEKTVKKAEALNLSLYTSESVKASDFANVLHSAIIVLNDDNAEQDEVDAAVIQLNNAINALDLLEPDTDDSNAGTDDSNSSTDDSNAGTDDSNSSTDDSNSNTNDSNAGTDDGNSNANGKASDTDGKGKGGSNGGKNNSPKTGDSMPIILLGFLLLSAGAVILVSKKYSNR